METAVHLPVLPAIRIHACLGRGGMGTVYAATTVDDAREVAIKVLTPAQGVSMPAACARFEREIAALSAIHHRNVVTLVGAGVAGGLPYALLERIEGARLDLAVLAGLDEVVAVGRQLAAAVACVHAAGWLHRDVKPTNVMIGAGGHVTLLDFGLAKLVDEPSGVGMAAGKEVPTRGDVSVAGTVVGTRGYLAPEVLRGGRTTTASDVFALGVVLRELLERAGVGPPRSLAHLLGRAVHAEPWSRPTATELAEALQRLPVSGALDDDERRVHWRATADLTTQAFVMRAVDGVGRHRPASRGDAPLAP